MTQQRKILVLESEKLLAAGLLSMLAAHAEFDVAHTPITTLASIDWCNTPKPDVVILEEGLLLANLSAVISFANRYPKLRLIVFRLSDNQVHVFDRQMTQVRQVSDFLELL